MFLSAYSIASLCGAGGCVVGPAPLIHLLLDKVQMSPVTHTAKHFPEKPIS